MNFFNYITEKLFPQKRDENLPFVQEELKRNSAEIKHYELWKESLEKEHLLNYIRNQYQLSLTGDEDKSMIRVLLGRSSYGFILRFPANIDAKGFQNLFDFFKETVSDLDYYTYLSDVKHFNRRKLKNDYIETIERHYLKPALKNLNQAGFPLNQLYGNILIELTKINDRPTHLKFQTNHYNDSKYKRALPFDDLMEKVLAQD